MKVNMNYFMKNGKLHKLPVPFECSVVREGERFYGSIPKDCELCPHCFSEEERDEKRRE